MTVWFFCFVLFLLTYFYLHFIYYLLCFYLFVFIYFYTHECLPTCMPVYHVHTWCQLGSKDVVDTLELDLQKVMSCHGVAGN